METLVKLDAPELQVIEKSKAEAIRATFEPMVSMLQEFEDAYNSIITTSKKEITEELTNAARRLRLDIGKVRIEAEKLRKEQKEEYLRAGKAIDAVNNILKWAVTDKENRLKKIEDYFEIQEQLRLEKLQADRAEKLSKYVEDAGERNLASMDEDVWKAYFSTKKQEYEDRIAAEKKAEEERRENEKLDRIEYDRKLLIGPYITFIEVFDKFKKENPDVTIRTMDENKYQELLASLKKAKADYDAEQERIRKENERIKKEQEEFKAKLQKAEAEIKAKQQAEEDARQKAEQEKRKAEMAPDKDKLLAFAARLEKTEIPEVDSEEADKILAPAISAIAHTAKTIRNLVKERL